jgi:GEVED domain/Secretion system C-terminal sorting domain
VNTTICINLKRDPDTKTRKPNLLKKQKSNPMVKRVLPAALLFFLLTFFTFSSVQSQCPAGFTAAQANWDYLDYYYNSGVNLTPYGFVGGNYVSNAQEQTQRFAIGPNSFSIVTSAAGIVKGENALHTGDIAGYTGQDAQFTPTANGQTITITFATPCRNASFALYGIDASAVINVTAADAAAGALTVTAVAQAPTILVIAGAVGKTLTANATVLPNTDNRGTATITVAGTVTNPVKSITIACTTIGTNAAFWLSDINACVSGSFPTNWHQGFNNRPFTGPTQNQPDYILASPTANRVYMMDPATGKVWYLFTDATRTYINSLAYDPNNKILYYTTENGSANSANKELRKYDFNTQTSSVVLADISASLGLSTFSLGVESAGAAFYNGQLYLGVEGGEFFMGGPSRESIIWRIDLDGSQNPIYACQVFGTDNFDGAGNAKNEWADFVVKDGMVVNYNASVTGTNYTNSSYTHFNMQTAAATNVYTNPSPTQKYAGQAGMNWAGNSYMVLDSIWQYNAGVISNKLKITLVPVPGDPFPPAWTGSSVDASDYFRPKCDFGDAPASYDPNPNSPAVHERSELIRLGATWDREWLKRGVTGTEDVDDGIATVSVMPPGTGSYLVQVTAFNNIGSNATLCAWLDINGNGVFDASEGITPITVPNSASNQNFFLYWPNYTTPLTIGQSTYLRVRITQASAGMTTAHATGYFTNGEVEDYKILIDNYPLSLTNLSFDASLINNNYAKLEWSANEDNNFSGYEIEKSKDSRNWGSAGIIASNGKAGDKHYEFNDFSLYAGTTYYRLKFIGVNGGNKFSEIRTVTKINLADAVTIKPNPVTSIATIGIEASERTTADIVLSSVNGRQLFYQKFPVNAGSNTMVIPVKEEWPAGMYILRIIMNNEIAVKKLIIL